VRPVRVADAAYRDLARLSAWLAPKNARAADLAADALTEAIESLAEFPERGRLVHGAIRELPVRFGRYGYVVRYRVSSSGVMVTRLRHPRESG
jgi:plasmid stabilization system protein ParE